jgi:hypothetical protein
MRESNPEVLAEPWTLLSKAESWHKLGLQNEAVIAADEAIEAHLNEVFSELGVPKPKEREKVITVLKKEGVRLSVKRLVRLKELREKATLDTSGILSTAEADEAISIAEDIMSKVGERQEPAKHNSDSRASPRATISGTEDDTEFHSERYKTLTPDSFSSSDLAGLEYLHRKDSRQVDTEFVTKLLLARAILTYKRKRIPRFVGWTLIFISMAVCLMFATLGGTGLILMLSGRLLFSLLPLAFDLMLLLVAYLSLRIALYVRRESN